MSSWVTNRVCVCEADLPGDVSMVPGVALQVCAAQLQLLLQLLLQFLRRHLQPKLLFGELKGHHSIIIRHRILPKKHTQNNNKSLNHHEAFAAGRIFSICCSFLQHIGKTNKTLLFCSFKSCMKRSSSQRTSIVGKSSRAAASSAQF